MIKRLILFSALLLIPNIVFACTDSPSLIIIKFIILGFFYLVIPLVLFIFYIIKIRNKKRTKKYKYCFGILSIIILVLLTISPISDYKTERNQEREYQECLKKYEGELEQYKEDLKNGLSQPGRLPGVECIFLHPDTRSVGLGC